MSYQINGMLRLFSETPDLYEAIHDRLDKWSYQDIAEPEYAHHKGTAGMFYDVIFDGTISASDTRDNIMNLMGEIAGVTNVMWIDTSNRFGNYTYTFSDGMDNALIRKAVADFTEMIRYNVSEAFRETVQGFPLENDEPKVTERLLAAELAAVLVYVNRDFVKEGLPPLKSTDVKFGERENNPGWANFPSEKVTDHFQYKIEMQYARDNHNGMYLSSAEIYYNTSYYALPCEVVAIEVVNC